MTGRAAAALALCIALAAGCGREPLPVLGTLPDFALTERAGTPVGSRELSGRPWIADFIFTRCPDVCPALSTRMARLQRELGDGQEVPRLVSISVDPVHDTPQVLEAYARHYGAGSGWWFLTGPRDEVARLLRDGFKVAFADDGPASSPITHSDRFMLVDGSLRIRGTYHGSDDDDLRRLAADVRRLQRETAG